MPPPQQPSGPNTHIIAVLQTKINQTKNLRPESNLINTLYRAIKAIQVHPDPLTCGKDAQKLKGIGPAVGKIIDEGLLLSATDDAVPPPSSSIGDQQLISKSPTLQPRLPSSQAFDVQPHLTSSKTRPLVSSNDTQQRPTKRLKFSSKDCLQYGSAPYSILLAMLISSKKSPVPVTLLTLDALSAIVPTIDQDTIEPVVLSMLECGLVDVTARSRQYCLSDEGVQVATSAYRNARHAGLEWRIIPGIADESIHNVTHNQASVSNSSKGPSVSWQRVEETVSVSANYIEFKSLQSIDYNQTSEIHKCSVPNSRYLNSSNNTTGTSSLHDVDTPSFAESVVLISSDEEDDTFTIPTTLSLNTEPNNSTAEIFTQKIDQSGSLFNCSRSLSSTYTPYRLPTISQRTSEVRRNIRTVITLDSSPLGPSHWAAASHTSKLAAHSNLNTISPSKSLPAPQPKTRVFDSPFPKSASTLQHVEHYSSSSSSPFCLVRMSPSPIPNLELPYLDEAPLNYDTDWNYQPTVFETHYMEPSPIFDHEMMSPSHEMMSPSPPFHTMSPSPPPSRNNLLLDEISSLNAPYHEELPLPLHTDRHCQDSVTEPLSTQIPKEWTDVPIITLPAGSFDIVILLDNREQSRRDRDYFQRRLENAGVFVDTVMLPVGDMVWAARPRPGAPIATTARGFGAQTYVLLDYIAERKRIDDLASSIRDSRWIEQKWRLERSGVHNLHYIVEESFGHMGRILNDEAMQKAICTAKAQTMAWSGFNLHVTKSDEMTADLLAQLTQSIFKRWAPYPLHVLSHAHIKSREEWIQYRRYGVVDAQKQLLVQLTQDSFNAVSFRQGALQRCLGSPHILLATLNEFSGKSNQVYVRDIFIRMLLTIRGVSAEKARFLVQHYPTPVSLHKAYMSIDESSRPLFLANFCERLENEEGFLGRKKIGNATSQRIAELFCATTQYSDKLTLDDG